MNAETLLPLLKGVADDLERAITVCCSAQSSLSDALGGSLAPLQSLMSTMTLDTSRQLDEVRAAIEALEAEGDAGLRTAAACLGRAKSPLPAHLELRAPTAGALH